MEKKKKRQMPSKEKKSELNFSLRLKSATKERKIWETNLKAYRNTCLNDTVRKIEQMSTGRKKKKKQNGVNHKMQISLSQSNSKLSKYQRSI